MRSKRGKKILAYIILAVMFISYVGFIIMCVCIPTYAVETPSNETVTPISYEKVIIPTMTVTNNSLQGNSESSKETNSQSDTNNDGSQVSQSHVIEESMTILETAPVSTESSSKVKTKTSEKAKKQYVDVFEGNITAYYIAGCGKSTKNPAYGLTASGVKAQSYHTIAMSSKYPFGTKVMIEGFDNTVFVCEDRGGAIKGNIIDVCMGSYEECINFGRQHLKVYIIEYGGK